MFPSLSVNAMISNRWTLDNQQKHGGNKWWRSGYITRASG